MQSHVCGLIGTLLPQASADVQLTAKILAIGGGRDAKTKSADLAAALGLELLKDAKRLKRVLTQLGAWRKESEGPTKFKGGTQAVGYCNIALKSSVDGEVPGRTSASRICIILCWRLE